jgi:hypothetical protein
MLIFLKEKGTGWPQTGSCMNNTNDISSLLNIQGSSIEQLRYYFFGNKPRQGLTGYQLPATCCRPYLRVAIGLYLYLRAACIVQLYLYSNIELSN